MSYIEQLLIICPIIFFAGFVDSIAGGGGLLSLPTYIAVGLPPKVALGTNKLGSTGGTFIATLKFIKAKKVDMKSALVAGAFAIIGSNIGARLAIHFNDKFLSYFMLIVLPIVFIFILKTKKFKEEREELINNRKRVYILSSIIGISLGCYDGFFGPGTGTFIMLAFNTIVGFDIVKSNGNAKVVNFSSNIAAVITFAMNGLVMYKLAIPALVFSVLGNYTGSSLAIKKGDKIIKPMLLFVFLVLIVKTFYDKFI
ncbi:MAG: TSUP family transporter [Lachnospirales bacterium]